MQSSGIHCKVATQNEVRRFLLLSNEYNSMLNQVCQVFGFSKDSVVIKYADDEGDFVTISSDEEVKFAIESAKGVLRLRVDQKRPIKPCEASPVITHAVAKEVRSQKDSDDDEYYDEDSNEDGESSGEHPKWRKKNAHLMENPAALVQCLQRLKQKRQKLQEKLIYLDSAAEKGNLGKGRYRHREKLRGKCGFISSRIERLTEVASRLAPVNPNVLQPQPSSVSDTPQQLIQQQQPQPSPATETMLTSPAALPDQENLSGSRTFPSKQDLVADVEELQTKIVGLRLALRQSNLQLQLARTNLQAVSHRGRQDAPAGPAASPEQVQEMKNSLGTAKANQAAAKADLHAQVQKLNLLVHQLKAIKQTEKAEWKAKKAAKYHEKTAWRADKMAKKQNWDRANSGCNSDAPDAPQPVQNSVSV